MGIPMRLALMTRAHAQRDFQSHSLRKLSWLLMDIQPTVAATQMSMRSTLGSVPHNHYPSGHYECHINGITAVMQRDEIKQYLDARWLGDAEAMYRTFQYHTHKEWPPVERLPIYLPDQQLAVYDPIRHDADQVAQRLAAKDTKLLAFFKLNQTDPHAHNLLYPYITIAGFLGLNVEMSQHTGKSEPRIPQQLVGCSLFHQLQANTSI